MYRCEYCGRVCASNDTVCPGCGAGIWRQQPPSEKPQPPPTKIKPPSPITKKKPKKSKPASHKGIATKGEQGNWLVVAGDIILLGCGVVLIIMIVF